MNKNDDKRKMLEEAANFFSPDQITTDKEKKDGFCGCFSSSRV